MKWVFPILFLTGLYPHTMAQVSETVTPVVEQQLEGVTAGNDDQETEDDAWVQQMVEFIKHPVDLNTADAAELQQLRLLNPLQVQNFLLYRDLVGNLISIYELQAVPGWDMATILKLRPYITVSTSVSARASIGSRLRKGDHALLARASQVLQRSKGYLAHDSTATNFYAGSPQKILLRYKYNFKNLLQYGIVAEKDAGEQFFKGKQKMGFDFYSAHIFIRKAGIIRALAIGDFTVNLGQGLVQWQSLAFKKSAEVINIKRESEVLRPYNSTGENNFHRGLGITLEKGNAQLSVFASYKKIDANYVADTVGGDHISSLQTSGYHRTQTEAADKGIQRQVAFGFNLSYKYKKWRLGLNGSYIKFRIPLLRTADPYNKFALSGSRFINYSFNYAYTFRNMHFFGEAAFTSSFSKAFVQGLIMSVSPTVDLSLLYRNIAAPYQALYAAAFTENSAPGNEKGLYTGLSIRPVYGWRLDAYADLYIFPWLRYRVDAPSHGADYLVQVSYQPNKNLEIYSRYQTGSKGINDAPGLSALPPVMQQHRQSWRIHIKYSLNNSVELRTRSEMVWFNKKNPSAGQGFLVYTDILYKPPLKPFSGTARLLYFETGGYNSRIYAYENDVLYSYSIPVFYKKGVRYYVNIHYHLNKKIGCWIRWAQTVFSGETVIGTGLDEIGGNVKSEVKLQVMYKF